MLICTLDIIIIGMLHNTMHINMLHKPIKKCIFIVNICLTLWLKRVIESIHHHNIQGVFHILGKHIIPRKINFPMLNIFIAWSKVTLAMYDSIKNYICNCYLQITLRLTNLDQLRFGVQKNVFIIFYKCA